MQTRLVFRLGPIVFTSGGGQAKPASKEAIAASNRRAVTLLLVLGLMMVIFGGLAGIGWLAETLFG